MSKALTLSAIADAKVVAVIRGDSAKEAIAITKAVLEGGINIIELTYTTPNVQVALETFQNSEAIVGAGTVLDPQTARHAILHGAKFIVGPHLNEEVAKICNRYTIPYFPGCMTIQEIVSALECGCELIKLFPANHFNPSFIKSVKGPLPHVKIMPTGGINADNINQWLDAGAIAAGIGNDLNKAYASGGYQAVVQESKKYVVSTQSLRWDK